MIVYKHTCIVSGKCYIGRTIKTMARRWQEHCTDAKFSPKRKFFAALNKYGTDCWEHEILFECDDQLLLAEKEIEFINLFNSIDSGYNTVNERGRIYTHTPESIEKMKTAQKESHVRKRAKGTNKGWVRRDGGAMKGRIHPNKGKESKKWENRGTRGWKIINGIRVWYIKEAAV